MQKFTITNLKKNLAEKTKTELIKEITLLCQKFSNVKEYYVAQQEDISEILLRYKKIIQEEFTGKGKQYPKARLSVAKKAVTDFKKLTEQPEYIIDIMLTYAESVSWFSTNYAPGEESFYTSPEGIFDDALVLAQKHQLEETIKTRAYNIVKNACDGWGHQDDLMESYENIFGEDDF